MTADTGDVLPEDPGSLVERRILDGPSLHADIPVLQLTLDVPVGAVAALGATSPGSAALTVCDAIAVGAGLPGGTLLAPTRPRIAPVPEPVVTELGTRVVLVRAWQHDVQARALGRATAAALEALAAGHAWGDVLAEAVMWVRVAGPGEPPSLPEPTVPVVAVTGTNGKTTTTRLVAHLARTAGLRTGWTTTDGVVVDGTVVEEGDWSGFGGAGQVLAAGVEIAILETARGGILLRGLGAAHNDVSVVTNVAADHLGLNGVDTVEQLADVKATVVRATRPGGWTVLNADDPLCVAMAPLSPATPWWFTLHGPGGIPAGARGTCVLDGQVAVLSADGTDLLLPVDEVPLTFGGLSRHAVANALAAASAGLAVGLPRAAVVDGLRTFKPDSADNPGRMNVFQLGGALVVLDLAHNEDALRALLELCRGLAARQQVGHARVLCVLGTAGDRTDELIHGMGVIAGELADLVVVAEKEKYLRGRDRAEMTELMRSGIVDGGGAPDAPAWPDEVSTFAAVAQMLVPGDVVAGTVHADRAQVEALLRSLGAVDAHV